MLFYTVKIVDALKREGAIEHRLVEYQAQAPTGAVARIKALEHHLAQPGRAGRAVRWAVVEPKPIDDRIIAIDERPLQMDELGHLERLLQPYVVA